MQSSGFADLYSRLRITDSNIVSHMTDSFTKTTALFSCVEVKPASGDHTEVEFQLSIWIAASLRKKAQLTRRVGQVDMSNLVEPCFAIVGHETHVYLGLCETRTVSGIFRALALWPNLIRYGRDIGSEVF
jgi:hypothetical protein